jgi:hypothetical protein
MKTYTVIGIYEDDGQRYADSFKAKDAEAAEKKATKAAVKRGDGGLIIAGTILGDVKMAS